MKEDRVLFRFPTTCLIRRLVMGVVQQGMDVVMDVVQQGVVQEQWMLMSLARVAWTNNLQSTATWPAATFHLVAHCQRG